jgi:Tetratricopeptide repeat
MRQAFPLVVVALATVAALSVGAPARAQPKTAAEWFNLGDNHYNLGEFDKAIDAFRKAFEIEKDEALKPIYLYNIAQSYRQAGDCDNAVFFYKRFLSLKANDTKKPLEQSTKDNILKRIAEQEKLCAEKNSNRDKPPEGTMRPENGGNGGSGAEVVPPAVERGKPSGGSAARPESSGTEVAARDDEASSDEDGEREDGEREDTELAISEAMARQPKVISLRVGAGLGIPNLDPVSVANQLSTSLIGGYPIALGDTLGVDVGAALSFSPLQWTNRDGVTETSLFVTAVVNAGLRVEVIPNLLLRGDVGAGAMFFTNIAAGNPFTVGGQEAAGGALTMFHVRVGAAAEYAASKNFSLWASPFTLGYSPAKEGLLADSITQISFLAGAGYRM